MVFGKVKGANWVDGERSTISGGILLEQFDP